MGSILKIYAVEVGYTGHADYFQYGNSIPHNTKNGETIIYFFNKREGAPHSLNLASPHFDKEQFTPIAIFTKKRHFPGIVTKP